MVRPHFFNMWGSQFAGRVQGCAREWRKHSSLGREETSASTWICIYSYTSVFRTEIKYLPAEQLERICQQYPDPRRGDAPLISHVESFPTGIVFFSRAIACSSYSRAIPLALFPDWPAWHLPALLSEQVYSHHGAGIYIWHVFLLFLTLQHWHSSSLFMFSKRKRDVFQAWPQFCNLSFWCF